jgi:hypothetical protein
VLDVPEAIFSNLGLTFLAHTHIPTIWDNAGQAVPNVDWVQYEKGDLSMSRTLPNGVQFGATIAPKAEYADLTLWLENGSDQALTDMSTQVCLMLKGAPAFAEQTDVRNTMVDPVAAIKAKRDNKWILFAFDHCHRTWMNIKCPCIHSDPFFPDTEPGKRVTLRGRLWFYQGDDIEGEIERGKGLFGDKD